jgi:hypothetical protein
MGGIFSTELSSIEQKLNFALPLIRSTFSPPIANTDVQATPPVSDIQQSTLITFFIYYLTVKIE